MGRIREFTGDEASSCSESLVMITMWIVGLPVEVHIKDGSVYSGIFHTASLVKGYGIVLKKARMIRKGTHEANVADGGLVDTLVVLSGDLVQVVAKEVILPADGFSSGMTDDNVGACIGTKSSAQSSEKEAGSVASHVAIAEMDEKREARGGRADEKEDVCHHNLESLKVEAVLEVPRPTTTLDDCISEFNAVTGNQAIEQQPNGTPPDNVNAKSMNPCHDNHHSSELKCGKTTGSGGLDCIKPASDACPGSLVNPTQAISPQTSLANKGAKESKLNPGAKVFSPSFLNVRSPTPHVLPTVASMAYAPDNNPVVPLAATQLEGGTRPIVSRSSWPVKYAPFVNHPPANSLNSQYNQPINAHVSSLSAGMQIAGPVPTRAQPLRYGAHYQPIQARPPFSHPNPQNGMIGRPGQVLYMHPVSHDVIQGAAVSHLPHPLLTPHQIHVPKHEEVAAAQALQLSVTPSLATNTQQPFVVPSHIQLSQPLFSGIRPVPVPVIGSNWPYKFP